MQPHIQVVPESLNANANVLVEIAGLLGAGRPDHDLSLRGRAPASAPDVSAELRSFAEFAADQYQDLVAILAALSTRLTLAAGLYSGTDQVAVDRIHRFLQDSRYVAPQQR